MKSRQVYTEAEGSTMSGEIEHLGSTSPTITVGLLMSPTRSEIEELSAIFYDYRALR